MLERVDGRVSPDGIGSRHVSYSVKGVQKAHFRAIMSLTIVVKVEEVTLVEVLLRTGLGLVVGACGMGVLRLERTLPHWLGAFLLSTIYSRIDWVPEDTLRVAVLGRYGVVWLVQVNEGIMESHVFSGLPQAAWGRGGGDIKGVYMGVYH